MLYLNVPYLEKNKAKILGAKWDSIKKKWYIDDRDKYIYFTKWLPNNALIICERIYLIEGVRQCFKCKNQTKVICLGIDNFFDIYDNEIQFNNDNNMYIVEYFENIPDELKEYIKNNYNFKQKYSNFIKDSYMANCCENCDSLQGNYFLFNELESPFFPFDKEEAKKLTMYVFNLVEDMVVLNVNIHYFSNNFLYKQFSKFKGILNKK